MRLNLQTSQKLILKALSAAFITLWAVILVGAQPLSLTDRALNPDNGGSVKKEREPNTDKSRDEKLGAKNTPSADGKAANSQVDATDHLIEIASTPSSGGKVAGEPNVADRLSALEEAIRSQNKKLNQMQMIIDRQQRTIEMLAGKPPAATAEWMGEAVQAAALSSNATVKNKTAATAPKTVALLANQTEEGQKQTAEDSIQKIGPIRWGGDFRLRFDSIFRPASKAPESPLQHQQNVRMRYRFRLNLDAETTPYLSFHGQLSTGTLTSQLNSDQDFTNIAVKHLFFINEAWIDFHPNKSLQLQAGRLQPIFSDGSQFIFDDDIRLNGFNEKFTIPLKNKPAGVTKIEFRAGQYLLTNPVVAIVEKDSPLNLAGAEVGSTGRSANLFHQGFIVDQKLNERWSQQIGADIQLYRNPNQILLASTQSGAAFLIQPGIGVALSGPLSGLGNATTTPGGTIYTARRFEVVRATYRINNTGFTWGDHKFPISLYAQLSRNVGTGAQEREAMMATLQVGKLGGKGDMAFTYLFTIKGANSMIAHFTDEDIGSGSGVNIRAHQLRWDIGLSKNVSLQTMMAIRKGLRSSGQYPDFFVPLEAFVPTLYRFQERLLFTF